MDFLIGLVRGSRNAEPYPREGFQAGGGFLLCKQYPIGGHGTVHAVGLGQIDNIRRVGIHQRLALAGIDNALHALFSANFQVSLHHIEGEQNGLILHIIHRTEDAAMVACAAESDLHFYGINQFAFSPLGYPFWMVQ